MISQAVSVAAFLKTVSDEERAILVKLRKLLRADSKVSESMPYRMPTSMVGANIVGAFNKQKQYLCLSINPDAVDPFRKELKATGLDGGKSCIRFRKPERLPLALAARISKVAVGWAKS